MLTKKNIHIALIGIILLGAFLRFYKLGNNSFVADEFLDMNSTYAYLKTNVWQNWDFNFDQVNAANEFQARDERAWVYRWQVAQLLKIFPPTEAVARTVSAIWGIVTIFLMYLVGKYFTEKRMVGLLSAFLFAVSIIGLELDRRFRMYAMFLPVYLLLSWFLFRFLEEDYTGKSKILKKMHDKLGLNLFYLLPALFLSVASFLTHQLTVNIIAVLGVYLFVWAVISWRKNKKLSNRYAALIGLGIVGLVSALILFPQEVAANLAGLQFFNDHFKYLTIVLSDYSHFLLALIFLVLGIYAIFQNKQLAQKGNWLIVSFFVPLLAAVFLWNRNVGNQYIFFILSFGIIFIAAGIHFAADFFKNKLVGMDNKKVYLSVILLALLILPNYAYFFQENNTYRQTSSADNPNYRKIFAYFKKQKNEGDVLITRNFRNYYWSGTKVKIFDFGGELAKEKLSLNEIINISTGNPSGWFIVSSNDESYIANDAMEYVEKNFQKVSNSQVRGDVKVYRWGESQN